MHSASTGKGGRGRGGRGYFHCKVKCFRRVVVAASSTLHRPIPSNATTDVTRYVAYTPLRLPCRTASCSHKHSVQNRVEVLHEACSLCAVPFKAITPAFFLSFLLSFIHSFFLPLVPSFSTPGCLMLDAALRSSSCS